MELLELGRVGIWTFSLDLQPMTVAQEAAADRSTTWRELAGALPGI